jgi:hypothetical protein
VLPPHPINREEQYLAAILDELKAIRGLLLPRSPSCVENKSQLIDLKEPAKPGKKK